MKRIKILMILALVLVFWVPNLNAQVMDSPTPNDGVFEKIHVINRKPIPWTPMREADAMWTKRIWRIIDMREKINFPLYYPVQPVNGRRSIMQVMLDALKEGTLTAYDAISDEFLMPKQYDEIIASLTKSDSIEVTDSVPPYDTHWEVITKNFDASQVFQLRIKEDWFFDRQRSVMDVRVLGICPILQEMEDDGVTFKGVRPLFWIYFPEARELFASAEVFNRFNDAERRSLDDIFYKRMFSSYVYQEANVYDRKISEYATGMDALLEAERVKNDIFLLEHDLWEY